MRPFCDSWSLSRIHFSVYCKLAYRYSLDLDDSVGQGSVEEWTGLDTTVVIARMMPSAVVFILVLLLGMRPTSPSRVVLKISQSADLTSYLISAGTLSTGFFTASLKLMTHWSWSVKSVTVQSLTKLAVLAVDIVTSILDVRPSRRQKVFIMQGQL